MTVSDWLTRASVYLEKAHVETAHLDALVLLEDRVAKDRAWLLAHPESQLTTIQETALEKLLKRRAAHEPLAYVRGHCEFYGRKFVLTPAVLQPRPETETLIDVFKGLVSQALLKPKSRQNLRVADIGTGSGAIGITIALELPNCKVELLEIDKKAAEVAKLNVDLFTLNISVIISDLLVASRSDFDVLLCNLPYIPDDHHVNLAALHEPRRAIYGGLDGLDVYRKLFDQVRIRRSRPLLILTESLPPQHRVLKQIAKKAGYRQLQVDDFIQVFQSRI